MTAVASHPYTRDLGLRRESATNLVPCAYPGCGLGPYNPIHERAGNLVAVPPEFGPLAVTAPEIRQVKRLHLERDIDTSGISGTGAVAYGACFPDGSIVLRWDTKVSTTVHYASLEDLLTIVGHGGATRVVWDDT